MSADPGTLHQRTVTIASSVGLHARPAAIFVEKASSTGLDVEIARPGEDPVDATSILKDGREFGVFLCTATKAAEIATIRRTPSACIACTISSETPLPI